MTTCQCCPTTVDHVRRSGASLRDHTPPGWGVVMDVGNGLEARFVCPKCAEVLGRLAREIQDHIKIKHFHFPSLLKLGTSVKEG